MRGIVRARHWFKYMPQKPLHGKQTRLHAFKWWLIKLFRIHEFSVNCECGNKIRMTDGVKNYEYTCARCEKDYIGVKKRVFS